MRSRRGNETKEVGKGAGGVSGGNCQDDSVLWADFQLNHLRESMKSTRHICELGIGITIVTLCLRFWASYLGVPGANGETRVGQFFMMLGISLFGTVISIWCERGQAASPHGSLSQWNYCLGHQITAIVALFACCTLNSFGRGTEVLAHRTYHFGHFFFVGVCYILCWVPTKWHVCLVSLPASISWVAFQWSSGFLTPVSIFWGITFSAMEFWKFRLIEKRAWRFFKSVEHEKRLRKSGTTLIDALRSLLGTFCDASCECDDQGYILTSSPHLQDILGVTQGDLSGVSVETLAVNDLESQRIIEFLARCVARPGVGNAALLHTTLRRQPGCGSDTGSVDVSLAVACVQGIGDTVGEDTSRLMMGIQVQRAPTEVPVLGTSSSHESIVCLENGHVHWANAAFFKLFASLDLNDSIYTAFQDKDRTRIDMLLSHSSSQGERTLTRLLLVAQGAPGWEFDCELFDITGKAHPLYMVLGVRIVGQARQVSEPILHRARPPLLRTLAEETDDCKSHYSKGSESEADRSCHSVDPLGQHISGAPGGSLAYSASLFDGFSDVRSECSWLPPAKRWAHVAVQTENMTPNGQVGLDPLNSKCRGHVDVCTQTAAPLASKPPAIPGDESCKLGPEVTEFSKPRRTVYLRTASLAVEGFARTPRQTFQQMLFCLLARINMHGSGCCFKHVALSYLAEQCNRLLTTDCSDEIEPQKEWQCVECRVLNPVGCSGRKPTRKCDVCGTPFEERSHAVFEVED